MNIFMDSNYWLWAAHDKEEEIWYSKADHYVVSVFKSYKDMGATECDTKYYTRKHYLLFTE